VRIRSRLADPLVASDGAVASACGRSSGQGSFGGPRRGAVAGSLALIVLLLAGCQTKSAINREPHSGATTASVVAGVQTVALTTGPSYRFTPATITVHPGRVRITLTHTGKGGAPHDWQLLGLPAAYVPLINPGQTKTVEFTAPAPGTYTFICTIHVKQGQTGTLVVLPS